MDIYIVMEGARVVGASAKLQGAELLRSEQSALLAKQRVRYNTEQMAQAIYNRMQIVNVNLQDMD